MSDNNFTTDEQVGLIRGSVPLLWRFIGDLPYFRILLVASVVCGLLGAAGFNLFVWLVGQFSSCSDPQSCSVSITVYEAPFAFSLAGLCFLAVAILVVRVVGWALCEVGGQLCSLELHRRMISAVGHTRTTFFDEFPSGKLINRMVRDFDSLRVFGPIRIGDTLNALIELTVIAIVVGFANIYAALAVLPTLLIFAYIQSNVAPMLQRCLALRSVRLGEVLHRETDVIEGVRTFVLYNTERALFGRLRDAVRRFIEMHVLRLEIEAWGRFWSQFAAALYSFLAMLVVAYGIRNGMLSAVLGAVVITAVFRIGSVFGWLTWAGGMLFESAAHVRRVFEYVDLPPEESEERLLAPPREVESSAGVEGRDLVFSGYTMSYRNTTPIILNNLNLTIRAGEKVGIIGRTGAGKTSLMQSLFRMVHVHSGDIRFGELSLFSLPIDKARELFGVVPQDPYLFEGTIRANLDRYNEHSDEVLGRALATVQLTYPLSMQLHEGGRNLSLGERQLLCLARVMLSQRPIVVMDEPTSGVDTITDSIMQRILRTALADRTVLTIAHRTETLSRVDRIIEIEDGEVVREGPPQAILKVINPEALA